ncbi:hypothetical protein BU23DRAFT_242964 [Bimuria novae-zelandiae CBS 107.79]|uniref:C3H1-type domain-containing protein n=1 Tax=Bimuria novae-zelandiae CBS 107.79 TaxID=1447943 RepID=A0A6A5UZ81_9PLEO|nr:hypothetical protein BU23DRAFT_242964 [Bimuria novae-zelandiae CBS 107.79]
MAPGFKFPPPPPPPPPKAPSNDAPNSQRGGQNERGRERGGAPGRSRGNYQGNSRGGYQQRAGGNQRGGHRGGQQHHGGRGGYQSHGIPNGSHQQQQLYTHASSQNYASSNSAIPDAPLNAPSPAPLDPGALAQAMAFMATPAGMQSMAAFASHMAGGNAITQNGQPSPLQQPVPHGQTSLQSDSRKRKRNDRVGQWQAQQQPRHTPTPKPPRAKAKAAPAVPGFGFSLPVPKPPAPSNAVAANGETKKRLNLGLTQLNYNDESSEEEKDEEEDEEAAFASKWDGKGISFEHNGDVISLQSAAEVAAYIKDRKRNYPTQARIAEKAQKAAEKRVSELEFLRKIKGTSTKGKTREEPKAKARPQKEDKEDKKEQPASPKPRLEELREKVRQSMAAKQLTPAPPPGTEQQAVDLGLGYGTDSNDESSVLSESSVVSSSESSDESEFEDDDSDAPPEAQSSRVAIPPAAPAPPSKPPARKVADPDKAKSKVCPQWKATGKCKFKYCHFRHALEEPKLVGLYERMVEAELAQADKLAVDAIKYLGRNGFLG